MACLLFCSLYVYVGSFPAVLSMTSLLYRHMLTVLLPLPHFSGQENVDNFKDRNFALSLLHHSLLWFSVMNYNIVHHYGVTDPSLFDCSTIFLSNRHIIQYRLLILIGNPFSKKQSKSETAIKNLLEAYLVA